MAAILVVATACQNAGDGAFMVSQPKPLSAYPGLVVLPPGTIFGATRSDDQQQFVLQFAPGTSAAVARSAGDRYSLELTKGPLISGPFASGRYVFDIPQIYVDAITPTTGVALFPKSTKVADRLSFLREKGLRFVHWQRSDEDFAVALVGFPPSQEQPLLIDPIQGRYQIQLPVGLTQESVQQWAQDTGLTLISYSPDTGATIVRPMGWTPPAIAPIVSYPAPAVSYKVAPSPPAPASTLYVQFATSLSSDAITSIAQGLGLGVISVTVANLATLSVDASKATAATQLLSDLATVQCVSMSPDPCNQIVSTAQPSVAEPHSQQFGQATGLSAGINGGVLELRWAPAVGATAYAIFRSESTAGPFELVALVAGQQNTRFQAFDLLAPGASAFYAVIALHPCAQGPATVACDITTPTYDTADAVVAAWTNPAPGSPAPQQPAQAPAPPAGATPAPQQTVAAPAVPTAPPAAQQPATPAPAASPSPQPPAAPAAPDASPSPQPPDQTPAAPATPQPSLSVAPAPASSSPEAASPAPTPVASSPSTTVSAPAASAAPPSQPQPPAQTAAAAMPLGAPAAVAATAIDGHVSLSWQPVAGAAAYRIYRSESGAAAMYVATTADTSFVDVGGTAGTTYVYLVAAISPAGLVGSMSAGVQTTWLAATSTPQLIRSLPAVEDALTGAIRLQVDASSGSGRGSVQWRIAGPSRAVTIGTANGQPIPSAPLGWSASLTWNTGSVPDGTYVVTATIIDAAGPQVTTTSRYRIQNGAPTAPTALNAAAEDGAVALTWHQAAAETGATYRLYRDQALDAKPLVEFSADKRSWVDSHVAAGQHVYQLVLVDGAGHRSSAAVATISIADAMAAPAPAAVVADMQVLLPNGEPLAPDGRATGHLFLVAPSISGLRFQVSSDGSSFTDLATTAACVDVCSLDLDLASLAPGPYALRALTAAGTSPLHSFVHADATQYPAPNSLTAAVGVLGVALNWTMAGPALPASYQVEQQVNGTWRVLDYSPSTSYIDAAAPPGVALAYRVAAVDPEGTVGLYSDPVAVNTPDVQLAEEQGIASPQAPTAVIAYASQGRATLRWESTPGTDSYLIERQLQVDGPFAVAGAAGGNNFTDTSLLTTGEVGYRVLGLDGVISGTPSPDTFTFVVPAAPVRVPAPAAPVATVAPTAPSALTVSTHTSSIDLAWAAPAPGDAVTYNVYRMDPASGVFALAASGLEAPSFSDTGLQAATYGYVVTSTSPDGRESPYSTPVWMAFAPSAAGLAVQWVAPAAAAFVQGTAVEVLANVAAAAGLSNVSFAFAPHGGAWHALPASPIDPSGPVPMAPLVSGAPAQWSSTLNTSGLAPGLYDLRAQATDLAGRSQEAVEQVLVAAPDARGPPSPGVIVTSTPSGVHVAWSSPTVGVTVQRSAFSSAGPFENLGAGQTQSFDDHSAIPGRTYWYRFIDSAGLTSSASSALASAEVASSTGGASIRLGAVSQSELSVAVTTSGNNHALPAGVGAVLGTFSIDATSLATGLTVHHLGEAAQVSFQLPSGIAPAEISSLVLYHWDTAAQGWAIENATADGSQTSFGATVNHLSEFMVAVASSPSASTTGSQPPSAPTDFRGAPDTSPALKLPPTAAPLQVAADGEVISLRSVNSRTYRNADGTFQQTISSVPLNFKDANGNWQKIDTTLVQSASGQGNFANAAGPAQINLPLDLSRKPVTITSGAASLSFSLEGSRAAARSAQGSQASYHGILGGVDATYAITTSGLKESLVIPTPLANSPIFVFDIATTGVTLQRQTDGSVQAVDPTGVVQFVITAPWMHDAPSSASELGTTSTSIGVTLTGGAGSYRLTFTPDAAWLADAARLYPVTIDPSITVNWSNSNSYDDQINSYSATYNYSSSTYNYLPIGYTPFGSGSNPSRAMVQFNGFLGEGYYASSAYLQMYQYTNYGYQRGNCCTTFVASAATSGWNFANPNGVTWNTRPGTSTAYCSCQAGARTGAGWVTWDVTGLVRGWETHSIANNGFEVYATSENGPYNTDEFFYSHWNGSSIPQLVVNYDYYTYAMAVAFPGQNNAVPNGGTTHVTALIANTSSVAWGTDVKLSWEWVQNGAVIQPATALTARVLLPYSIPASTDVTLSFDLTAPTIATSGTVQVWFALVREGVFWFQSLSWCSGCGADFTKYTVSIANESGTITGQSIPPLLVASTGSLITVPVTIANTSVAGVYNWSASNYLDIVEAGSREYRQASGGIASFPNVWTLLPQDVAAGGNATVNVLLRVPAEPGDYWLRVDLVRYRTESSTTWFEDSGNRPLEVHVRVVAPGDDKVTLVPVPIDDGSTLGTNTTNGYATLKATDFSIPERGEVSLQVLRTYNGANAAATTTGTGSTGTTYGQGWTFDFQRNLQLGGPATSTLGHQNGILTDASGRAWLLTWNPNRQLWEDAAGDRVVIPSSSVVQSATGDIQTPGVQPVDVISRTGNPIGGDGAPPGTTPRGLVLNLDGSTQGPNALVLPAGTVPAMQNGTIEFWFRPDFNMGTDTNRHVFLVDHKNNFGLQWNGDTANPRSIGFFTYDGSTWDTVESGSVTWAQGSWHHITITWQQNGLKQLVLDQGTPFTSATHGQAPVEEVFVGYNPDGSPNAATYPLGGAIAELRVEGRVLSGGEIQADAATATKLTGDGSTLYLGTFVNGVQSAAGSYTLRNPDQSVDVYAPAGQLISTADRFGNGVDYTWNGSQLASIADHYLPSRNITFSYPAGQVIAQDFSGRTITYTLSAGGDLVSVTHSNQVPSPTTGVVSNVPFTTTYAYLANHALQSVTDPMGRKVRLSYDSTYAQLVLADSPTSYFRLNEFGGLTAANAAGAANGTMSGGITTGQPGPISADPDTAFAFDGSSGYITVSSIAPPPAGGAFSLEAWANQLGGGASTQGVVGFSGSGASWTTGIMLTAAGIPSFQITTGTGSTQTTISGTSALGPGWHHLVATYDGANALLYVDGRQVAATSSAVSTAGGLNTMYVGQFPGSYFKGSLGEVAMYGSALALDHIQRHFVAGRLGTGAAAGTYAAGVVLDQAIGYWRLGDSKGTRAMDSSGGGRIGTVAGGVTFGVSGALTGDPAGAAAFDGSSGYISIPDNPSAYATGTITAEAWISVAGYTSGSIINRRTTTNVGGFTLELTAAGLLYFFVYIGTTWYSAASPFSVPIGGWHHVAGTYDGTTIRVFIDGVNVASTAISGSMNAPAGPVVWIGRNASGPTYFNGSISEVALYKLALSQAQVLTDYNAGRLGPFNTSGPYPGTVLADSPMGYWRLSDASGAVAADASGLGNAGTYAGSFALQQPGAFNNDTGHSTHFDGATAYVTTPTQSISSVVTVEAWVYTTTFNQSGFIVGKNPVNENWELFVYNNTIYWRTGGTSCGATGATDLTVAAPSANAWHHIVAVQNGAVGRIYIDGNQVATSSSMAQIGNSASPIEIGRYGTYGGCTAAYYFSGLIQDVAIYGSALPAARILSHFQAGSTQRSTAARTSPTSYSSRVIADGPVGYWRLDETGGSVAFDHSGYGNVGSYSGTGVSYSQAGALATDSDTAASFNGTTGSVSIPASSSLNVAGPITLEAWIYRPSLAVGPILEFNSTTGSIPYGVHLWAYPTPDAIWVNFVDTAGNSHGVQTSGGLFAASTWYHVAAVYDGAYGTVYLNGQQIARTYLGSFTPQTSFAFNIAKRPSGTPAYLGATIDEVAVYPYALSGTQLLAHYNAAFGANEQRVTTMWDGRGNPIASLRYNDDLAVTRVTDPFGLSSYYTFQQYGGRTLSVTDTGGNTTRYEYDGGAAYRLLATISAAGIRTSEVLNSGAPVGQQTQVLLNDQTSQPSSSRVDYMNGSVPSGATLYTTSDSWTWDPVMVLDPGKATHRSMPVAGTRQQYFTLPNSLGTFIPAGSRLIQWIYIEPGQSPPLELMLQLLADTNSWEHRAFWGSDLFPWGTDLTAARRPQGVVPQAGRWVALSIELGPTEGTKADVDLAGHLLTGIAFDAYGGTAAVWWGPTQIEYPGAVVTDATRAINRNAYNSTNDVIASVDPNGIAKITDYDGFGQARQVATGVEPPTPLILEDTLNSSSAWTFEFNYAGTSTNTSTSIQHSGLGSVTQTQTGAGLQSDLYLDRGGLVPGTYLRATVWAEVGVGAGTGGASLAVESAAQGTIRRSASIQSSSWTQLSVPMVVDSSGKVRIHLWQENFAGTTYWADMRLEDITPAPDVTFQPTARQSGWALNLAPGIAATWSNLAWGGVGNGPSRKISITSATTQASDVSDTLVWPTLHNGYTYVLSLWASASVPGTTVDFSLRDANGNPLTMDNPSTCAITTAPTLCQNSITYTGNDLAANQLTILYGGFGARDVYVSHPLVAMASEVRDYTAFGQLTRISDVFGHDKRTDYDAQSLYPIQTTQKIVQDNQHPVLPSSSYTSAVMADQPLAYWRLGDTSGSTATDSTGHGFGGTISATGVALGVAGPLPADPGKAMAFDGSTGTIALNVTSVDTTSGHQVTAELWMYWAGGTNTSMPFLFGSYDLWLYPGVGFGFNSSNNDLYGVPMSAIPANKWLHVVAVFTNGNIAQNQLFINGVAQSLSQLTGTPSAQYAVASAQANISGRSGAGYQFNGRIGEVALYNGALSSIRVQSHYALARPQVQSAGGAQPTYTSSVMFDQPKAYWRLDEQAGTVAIDSSRNGQSGTYSGGVSLNQTGALPGDSDVAAAFNGTTGTVTVNVPSIDTVSGHQVSVELWMNWAGTAGGQMAFGFNSYDLFVVPGTGFGFNTANGDVYGVPMSAVPANTWLHVVAVFTNGTTTGNQIFINGVQQTLTQLLGSPVARSVTTAANISNWPTNTGYYFNGRIDEVAIYNGALSKSRVVAHYQARLAAMAVQPSYAGAVSSDRPLGYWRLNDAAGTTAVDGSGGGNNGTIAGSMGLGALGPLTVDSSSRAMKFDASSTTVSLKQLGVDTAAGHQVTVEFWMYSTGAANVMPFGFGYYDLFMNYPTVGNLGFNTGNSDTYGVSGVPQNTWLHVVAVFTNGNIAANQLYINGVRRTLSLLAGASVYSSTVTANANIGSWPTSSAYYFGGLISEVALYNGALSSSQVLTHYQTATGAPVAIQSTPPSAPALPALASTSVISQVGYNALGQQVTSTRVSGSSSIVDKHEMDSWGRVTAEIKDYMASGPTDAQTNVRTGHAFNLDGQETDTYTQSTTAGQWVIAHGDYDAAGNHLDEIQNSGGSPTLTTTWTYDALNRVTDEFQPIPGCTGSCAATDRHTVYDSSDRVLKDIANYGGSQDVSQANVTTTYGYDGDGRVVDTYSPISAGSAVGAIDDRNVYDGIGRLVSVIKAYLVSPVGLVQAAPAQTDYALDAGDRIVSETSPVTGTAARRIVTNNLYDALGEKVSITVDATGATPALTRMAFDPRGAIHEWSAPTQQLSGGMETSTYFDLGWRPVRVVADDIPGAPVAPDVNLTSTTSYDGFGRATDLTDPKGIVTHTDYDALNRVADTVVDPGGLNLQTTYTYDLAGNPTKITRPRDGSPRNDTSQYDALHRLTAVTLNYVNGAPVDWQTNLTEQFTYDLLGNRLTSTEASGRVTVTAYDALGRVAAITQNCVGSNFAVCDGAILTDQNVSSRMKYDAAGDKVADISPRTGGTDAANLTTGYAYDAQHRLVLVTEDSGSSSAGHANLPTAYGYDAAGNLLTTRDGLNHVTTNTVDDFGRVTAVTDANNNVITTNYSSAGEVTSVINASSPAQTISYGLDRVSRTIGINFTHANGTTGSLSYAYDLDGQITAFQADGQSSTAITYDNAGRVTQVAAPSGTTSYCNVPYTSGSNCYYLDGTTHSVSDPSGLTIFTEDALGRLTSTQDPLDGSSKTSYSYDLAGRLVQRNEATGLVTNFSWTHLDQLQSKTVLVSGAPTPTDTWSNQYDMAGNRTQESSQLPGDTSAGNANFTFDNLNQVATSAIANQPALAFAYDAAHNRCVTAPSATAVNACSPTQNGWTTYSYQTNEGLVSSSVVGGSTTSFGVDGNGNQQHDAQGHVLKYDSLNRLEQVLDTSNNVLVSYTYDAMGRLIQRNQGGAITQLVYRGLEDQVVELLTGSPGTVTQKYAWDDTGRMLTAQVGGANYSVLTNPHGDVVGLSAGNGNIANWAHYGVWGQVIASGSPVPNSQIPFGYQSSYADGLTGLVKMGLRWYDPIAGRFASSDPTAVDGNLNAPLDRSSWDYANNNPIVFTDPTGLDSSDNQLQDQQVAGYKDAKGPNLEQHHGVLDAWASAFFGTARRVRGVPTVALTKAAHQLTNAVIRDFLRDLTGKPVGAKVDWGKVTARQVLELSEKMFDAAGVSRDVRDKYYGELQQYIENIAKKMVIHLPEPPVILDFPPVQIKPGVESIPLLDMEPNILTTPLQDLSQLFGNVEMFPVGSPVAPLVLPFPRATYRDPGLLTFIRHFVYHYAPASSSGCASCAGQHPPVHHGIEDRRLNDPSYDPSIWNIPSYAPAGQSGFDWGFAGEVAVVGLVVVAGVLICILACEVLIPAGGAGALKYATG